MTGLILAILAFCLLAHVISILIAAFRCRRSAAPVAALPGMPAVSIVRPVCGLDNFAEETLRSSFRLAYPRYEILFCVARADDAAVPVIRKLIGQHPDIPARLLIGDDRISSNPKLNNVAKGWNAATASWVIIADSNVLMPRDYVQRLLNTWRADTGLVCSPPAGLHPANFAAELECAFLNSYQARWQYFADTMGFGFAQGKTMLWRRADLEGAGGIRALAGEAAEDAAATKVVRAAGLRVRLVDAPFGQPLGRRTWRDVWKRQMRWSRLRRASFLPCFLAEILSGILLPLCASIALAVETGMSFAGIGLAFLGFWYGSEMLLNRIAGWPLSFRALLAAMVRDLLLPALWIGAFSGSGFVWRGTPMRAVESGRLS
ncbi:MAG: ceramide glucosyltransferase [Pseudorhodoplanes sp.]